MVTYSSDEYVILTKRVKNEKGEERELPVTDTGGSYGGSWPIT